MKEKEKLKVEIWNLIIRYSEPIVQILFIISKRTEYEYKYHSSVLYYSIIQIENYSLQHWHRLDISNFF